MYLINQRNFHIFFSKVGLLYIAAVVLMMLSELCKIMHLGNELYYLVNFGYCVFFFGFLIFSWLEDISIESVQIQTHSDAVRNGLRIGIVLFIITEVMFFFSFFWAYFHAALLPSIHIGCHWSEFFYVFVVVVYVAICCHLRHLFTVDKALLVVRVFYAFRMSPHSCVLLSRIQYVMSAFFFLLLVSCILLEVFPCSLAQMFVQAQDKHLNENLNFKRPRTGVPDATEDLVLLTLGFSLLFFLCVVFGKSINK